jgi:hypothetical protein
MSESDLYADLDAAIHERDRSTTALRAALAAQMERLEARVASQEELWFNGEDFVLVPADEHDPEEIVGHFAVIRPGLRQRVIFCWLNTFEEAFAETGGYKIIYKADGIPYDWLRTIAKNSYFERFLADMARHVRGEASSNHDHAQRMSAKALRPASSIANELTTVARELGYDRVVELWSNAQAEANSEPDRAIALACTLVEETGHHLLNELGRDPPAKKTIKTLVSAVSKEMGLDPSKQAEGPMKGLCGALNTIAQSIGDLRSGHSEAHGRSPDIVPLGRTLAMFAVNSAGILSTFLMRRYAEHRLSSTRAKER